jgi:hypothetical protein
VCSSGEASKRQSQDEIGRGAQSQHREPTDIREQTADGIHQTVDKADSRQQADSRQETADNRRQTAASSQQTADSRQQTAAGSQQTADSRQQTADSRQQTADRGLLTPGARALRERARPSAGRRLRRDAICREQSLHYCYIVITLF